MAIKTFVTGSSTATIADNDTTIVGGTAGNEKVKILSGVTGTNLDGNIEKVDLAGSLADYKFVFVAGTGFQVQTTSGAVVTTIASLNQAATVAFADGSAQLTQTGNASVTLGNQTIGTTLVATTATALGATFDTTVKSTVNPTSTPGLGQTFTLTTGTDVSGVMTGSASTAGTEGNDTFTATGNGGATATYNTGDVINGGAGADVLNLALTATNTGLATVVGVETINVTTTSFGAVTFDARNVSTLGSTINLNNSQIGGTAAFTVTGLGSGSTVTSNSSVSGALAITTTAATTQSLVLAANSASTQSVALTGSGSSDVATLTAAGTVALTVSGVETVNLSGNGAAATYNVAGTAGQTFNLTGTQSLTIADVSATFIGDTITDSTTAGTTTLKIITTGGTADLSKVAVDLIDITANDTGTYTVKNNQAVKASIDLTSVTIDSTELTTGSETLNLTLAIGQAGQATVVSDFETVNLTIDDASSTVNTLTVFALTAGSTSVVNVTAASADNLTLTDATAASIQAAGFTKNLIVSSNTGVPIVVGGSGADAFSALGVTGGADADASFTGNAGNDTFTIDAFDLTNRTITFEGGAGVDTLAITSASAIGDRYTFTDVESMTVAANSTFDARDFTGKTLVLAGTAATKALTFDMTSATILDLSGLTVNSATTSITVANAPAFASTITGTGIGDTITGGSANDTINGGAGGDSLVGSGGIDSIIGGEGGDTITAGTGADLINLTETTAATDTILMTTGGVIAVDTVTGFKVGATSGDLLQVDLSDINGLVTDLSLAGDLGTDAAANATTVVTIVTGAYDIGTAATSDILAIKGHFTASTLEDALEIGGSRALTGNGIFTAGDAFLVAYDDGTDSYLAYVTSTAGIADNATFASGDLTVTNMIKLVGITDATTILTDNIDIVS